MIQQHEKTCPMWQQCTNVLQSSQKRSHTATLIAFLGSPGDAPPVWQRRVLGCNRSVFLCRTIKRQALSILKCYNGNVPQYGIPQKLVGR